MSVSKAVVMAAGRGTRMRRNEPAVALTTAQAAAADVGLKSMIPVGRPFLDYVLNNLADGGIQSVCIIVAAGDHRIRERYEREIALTRLRIEFVEQPAPTGTAHAVLRARAFAGSDPFLVLNGDNLYSADAFGAMCAADGNAIAGYYAGGLVSRGNIPRERLRAFAIIETNDHGGLHRIVEKPDIDIPIDDDTLISMNLWTFTTEMFSACERAEQSARGEFELAGAVERALRDGSFFQVVRMNDGVFDLTERRDIALVTARLASTSVSL